MMAKGPINRQGIVSPEDNCASARESQGKMRQAMILKAPGTTFWKELLVAPVMPIKLGCPWME